MQACIHSIFLFPLQHQEEGQRPWRRTRGWRPRGRSGATDAPSTTTTAAAAARWRGRRKQQNTSQRGDRNATTNATSPIDGKPPWKQGSTIFANCMPQIKETPLYRQLVDTFRRFLIFPCSTELRLSWAKCVFRNYLVSPSMLI